MLLVHERFHGLGMDAIMTICFGTRTLLMFGHGCSVDRMLLARNQNYAHGLMTVCFWHTNAIKVLAGGGVEWASFCGVEWASLLGSSGHPFCVKHHWGAVHWPLQKGFKGVEWASSGFCDSDFK